MATDPNQQDAEQTVFGNLGLSKEDLGAGELDTGAGESGFEQDVSGAQDDGDRQEQRQARQADIEDERPQKKDDLQRRVSHTEERAAPREPFRNAPVKPDRQGNLRDAQGNIVARAGKEARLYTTAHNARVEAQRITGERDEVVNRLNRAIEIGQEMHRELETYRGQQEQMRTFGLEQHEHLDAVQLAAEAKRDPMGVIKKLLTRAAASGIDLTQLGMQPGGVDAKSLMDMIRGELASQMKPVQDRAAREAAEERARREQQQEQQAVQGEVNQFFSQNPAARPFTQVFMEVLKQPRFQHMSLGEVWARIQLNLASRQRQSPNGAQRRPSLPNGRGGPLESGPTNRLAPVSPDTSYDDILRDILKATA